MVGWYWLVYTCAVSVLIELSEDQPSGNEYRDKRMHNILVKVRMLVSCVLNRILDSHIFLVVLCRVAGKKCSPTCLVIYKHE